MWQMQTEFLASCSVVGLALGATGIWEVNQRMGLSLSISLCHSAFQVHEFKTKQKTLMLHPCTWASVSALVDPGPGLQPRGDHAGPMF